MKEVVLGLGHQKSLWSVVQLADEQLRTIHGASRRMVVRGRGIEIAAWRPQFEGDYRDFTVRYPEPADGLRAALEGFSGRCPVACELAEVDGALVLHCTANSDEAVHRLHEACDQLSGAFPLPEVWRVHGEAYRSTPLSAETVFKAMIKFKSSDVHLYPGAPPVFRVDNVLRRVQSFEPLSSEQITAMIAEIAPEKHSREFAERQQCSFIYHQVGLGYARVSAFVKAGVPHCTMRFLPETIPSFEDLNIPYGGKACLMRDSSSDRR